MEKGNIFSIRISSRVIHYMNILDYVNPEKVNCKKEDSSTIIELQKIFKLIRLIEDERLAQAVIPSNGLNGIEELNREHPQVEIEKEEEKVVLTKI